MSWQYDPSAWVSGSTIPALSDYQAIATDLHTRGANADGNGYGRANTSFVVLVPGELPGSSHSVTGASWTGGTATLTIGGHTIGLGQRLVISGITPSGYNTTTDSVIVTGVTGTTISYALAANPGSYSSGGTVTVNGTSPVSGMIAVDENFNFKVYNGSSWVAATTAASAPVWWVASGVPGSGLGNNGDMYLNDSTGDVYGPKTAGAWGSIDCNLLGPTGYSAVWNVGAGAPGSGTGNNGDMYLNSSNGAVYGPKAAGAWGSVDCNITGPSGAAGNTEPINNQTGTSYTFGSSDWSKLVTFSNSSAIAGTLPQAGTVGIANTWYVDVQNRGAGTLTITTTTSVFDGGGSTLTLTTGQGCRIATDGTNYFTQRGMSAGGGYSVATQNCTSGTTNLTVTANEIFVTADATSGNVTVNLYAGSTTYSGNKVRIVKTDSSTNTVTLGGTINGGTNKTIAIQNDSYTVMIDSAGNWRVV